MESLLQTYRRQVRDYVATNFYVRDLETLRDNSSLLDQGIIDSTGVLEVVGFVEDTFAIQVEDDDLRPENFDSIDRIASFIARKRPKGTK